MGSGIMSETKKGFLALGGGGIRVGLDFRTRQ